MLKVWYKSNFISFISHMLFFSKCPNFSSLKFIEFTRIFLDIHYSESICIMFQHVVSIFFKFQECFPYLKIFVFVFFPPLLLFYSAGTPSVCMLDLLCPSLYLSLSHEPLLFFYLLKKNSSFFFLTFQSLNSSTVCFFSHWILLF